MSRLQRLQPLDWLPPTPSAPTTTARAASGIVHLGVGAFQRAHLAPSTDAAIACDRRPALGHRRRLAAQPRHARCAGAAGRPLHARDPRCRRTTARRASAAGDRHCSTMLVAPEDPARGARAHRARRDPHRQPDRHREGLPPRPGDRRAARSTIRHRARPDAPAAPRSALGFLVHGLRRRSARLAPVTLLSLDNLPANGDTLRELVLALRARARCRSLADWIEARCTLPELDGRPHRAAHHRRRPRAHLGAALGVEDAWPVVGEPFLDWVDRRPLRRRPPRLAARRRPLRRRCEALRDAEAAHGQRQPFGARLPRRDGRLAHRRRRDRAAGAAPLCRRADARRGRAHAAARCPASTSTPTARGCCSASRTRRCSTAPRRSRWTARRSCRSACSARCATGCAPGGRSSGSRSPSPRGSTTCAASTRPARATQLQDPLAAELARCTDARYAASPLHAPRVRRTRAATDRLRARRGALERAMRCASAACSRTARQSILRRDADGATRSSQTAVPCPAERADRVGHALPARGRRRPKPTRRASPTASCRPTCGASTRTALPGCRTT